MPIVKRIAERLFGLEYYDADEIYDKKMQLLQTI